MSSLTISDQYNHYKPYVGPVGQHARYTQIGNGWGCTFKVEYGEIEGYSLTTNGVRKYLEVNQIRAAVCNTNESLNAVLRKLNCDESIALAIPTSALELTDLLYKSDQVHIISLFAERRADRLQLFINDSNGTPYSYDELRSSFKVDCKIQLFVSTLRRQHRGYVCQTFAIRDCKQFNKNPNLPNELLNMNGYTNNEKAGCFYMDELPECLLVSGEKIELKAQKYLDSFIAQLKKE